MTYGGLFHLATINPDNTYERNYEYKRINKINTLEFLSLKSLLKSAGWNGNLTKLLQNDFIVGLIAKYELTSYGIRYIISGHKHRYSIYCYIPDDIHDVDNCPFRHF